MLLALLVLLLLIIGSLHVNLSFASFLDFHFRLPLLLYRHVGLGLLHFHIGLGLGYFNFRLGLLNGDIGLLFLDSDIRCLSLDVNVGRLFIHGDLRALLLRRLLLLRGLLLSLLSLLASRSFDYDQKFIHVQPVIAVGVCLIKGIFIQIYRCPGFFLTQETIVIPICIGELLFLLLRQGTSRKTGAERTDSNG
ncbi:hypothetical protein GCM10027040_17500 [Halomonas shantousis]